MEKEIKPAFESNNIAISLQSSDYFVPYAAVTIRSIIEHTSKEYNYDILVTTRDMSQENKTKLCNMISREENISIRVIDVSSMHSAFFGENTNWGRFGSGENLTRIFLAEMLTEYSKIVNIDCDMIVCEDISSLFMTDISSYYMGAVQDINAYVSYYAKVPQTYFTENIISNILQLRSMEDYYNTGLMLLNLEKIRKDFEAKQMADFLFYNKLKLFEQDAFSHFFVGKVLTLDWAWNFQCDANWHFKNNIEKIYDVFDYNNRHAKSGKTPKIIHYLSNVKPWMDMSVRRAVVWWEYAVKTPFYSEIICRRSSSYNKEKELESSEKRLLFVCESVYQLMTALNVKMHIYANCKADLVLTSTTDFSKYVSVIKEEKIFEKIYISEYKATTEILNLRKTSPNNAIMQNPQGYRYAIKLSEKYSDYFMAVVSSPFSKILYYQLVAEGNHPSIHFYEDGWVTYIEPVKENILNDILNHELFGENERFINNITEVLLYRPELYANKESFMLSMIPKIKEDDLEFINTLYKVFGQYEMPEEQYIFFDECFSKELRASSDIEILDRIAKKVGKENVVVKLHPRSGDKGEFYKLHGYKILADNTVPWEIVVLSAELNNKVLISVSSASLLTPNIVYGKKAYSIYLWDVMKLSRRRHICLTNFPTYIEKALSWVNEKEKMCFIPQNMNELEIILEYLEGELQ